MKTHSEGISLHHSSEPGPSVLLLIGLHGDEAGEVEEPLRELVGSILTRGTVRIARCFPEQPPQRCVGPRLEDPNRAFPPENTHKDDFAERQRVLMTLVKEAEIVIDFHRYHQSTGGPIAFPFCSWGVEIAQHMGISRTVLGLVDTVEGALAMWAHRLGRKTLVLEAGPKCMEADTDHNVLVATHHLLAALDMTPLAPTREFKGQWPEGPSILRCHGAVAAAGLTESQRKDLDLEPHLGTLSERVIGALGLPDDARLLMINPDADPVAFACLPESEFTPAS